MEELLDLCKQPSIQIVCQHIFAQEGQPEAWSYAPYSAATFLQLTWLNPHAPRKRIHHESEAEVEQITEANGKEDKKAEIKIEEISDENTKSETQTLEPKDSSEKEAGDEVKIAEKSDVLLEQKNRESWKGNFRWTWN